MTPTSFPVYLCVYIGPNLIEVDIKAMWLSLAFTVLKAIMTSITTNEVIKITLMLINIPNTRSCLIC